MNTISSAVENLTNTAKSTEIALGRVLDADIAGETARRTQSQITQQSAIAMLAHKNTSSGMILRLIS